MKSEEFIYILECILKCADDEILIADFMPGKEDIIDIHYKGSIVYSIPIKSKTNLGILAEVSKLCYEERKNEDLIVKSKEDSSPSQDWEELELEQSEMKKFLFYLCRMTSVQKDYIFGKMALMMLECRNPYSQFLEE